MFKNRGIITKSKTRQSTNIRLSVVNHFGSAGNSLTKYRNSLQMNTGSYKQMDFRMKKFACIYGK
jgi:hypothetical protein